jgi:hypothetical protein
MSAIAIIVLWMLPGTLGGALAGYVVARIAKLNAKRVAAICALACFAISLATLILSMLSLNAV